MTQGPKSPTLGARLAQALAHLTPETAAAVLAAVGVYRLGCHATAAALLDFCEVPR